jgi:hypothetical protein
MCSASSVSSEGYDSVDRATCVSRRAPRCVCGMEDDPRSILAALHCTALCGEWSLSLGDRGSDSEIRCSM